MHQNFQWIHVKVCVLKKLRAHQRPESHNLWAFLVILAEPGFPAYGVIWKCWHLSLLIARLKDGGLVVGILFLSGLNSELKSK